MNKERSAHRREKRHTGRHGAAPESKRQAKVSERAWVKSERSVKGGL